MQLQATLIDFQRIYKTVENLEAIEKDKAIQAGLRAGANLFIKEGKKRLQERLKGTSKTGNLMKAFVAKLKRQKLGALAGFSQLGAHSHLVDAGTKQRHNGQRNTGKMPANHFWKDAVKSSENEAVQQVYKGIDRAINRILTR